jgi:predicted ATPase with chaperone activity
MPNPGAPLFEALSTSNRILPEIPETLEKLGLPETMVADLVLRYLRERGTGSFTLIRRALKLSFGVVEAVFQHLRQQQLIDVKSSLGQDFIFSLTSAGRAVAAEKAASCRYAGPAPVPLEQYIQVVRSQRISLQPTTEDLREAFRDLVLPSETLDELGVALTSGRPIFLYGPSGNGKTSIIERLPRLTDDTVLIPNAIEVDGHVNVAGNRVIAQAVHSYLRSHQTELGLRLAR